MDDVWLVNVEWGTYEYYEATVDSVWDSEADAITRIVDGLHGRLSDRCQRGRPSWSIDHDVAKAIWADRYDAESGKFLGPSPDAPHWWEGPSMPEPIVFTVTHMRIGDVAGPVDDVEIGGKGAAIPYCYDPYRDRSAQNVRHGDDRAERMSGHDPRDYTAEWYQGRDTAILELVSRGHLVASIYEPNASVYRTKTPRTPITNGHRPERFFDLGEAMEHCETVCGVTTRDSWRWS